MLRQNRRKGLPLYLRQKKPSGRMFFLRKAAATLKQPEDAERSFSLPFLKFRIYFQHPRLRTLCVPRCGLNNYSFL